MAALIMTVFFGVMERARKTHKLPVDPVRDLEKPIQRRRIDIQVFSPEEVMALVRAGDSEQDAREPLANGYLSGKYARGTRITRPDDWRSHHDPQKVEAKLDLVAQIQATEVPPGVPLARWALVWSLQHPLVSAVIPGSKSIQQLESNVAAADLDLVAGAHPLSAPN